jgi:hypothetical protein
MAIQTGFNGAILRSHVWVGRPSFRHDVRVRTYRGATAIDPPGTRQPGSGVLPLDSRIDHQGRDASIIQTTKRS